MNTSYYLVRNNVQYGPYTLEQLIQQGLTAADFVWHEGLPEWTSPALLPELAPYVSQPPQYAWTPVTAVAPQVSFGEAISTCFKKYATFKGRARRSEYWWFMLFNFLITVVTCGIGSIVLLLPSWAVTVRRLHDNGRSGWWWGASVIVSLVYLVAFYFTVAQLMMGHFNYDTPVALPIVIIVSSIATMILGIIVFVFTLLDSNRGTNRYGDSPKYPNG